MKVKSNQILGVMAKLLESPQLIIGTIQRENFYYFMTQNEILWSIGRVDEFIELHLENCNNVNLTIKNLESKSLTGDYFIFSSADYSTKLFYELLETVKTKVNGLHETLNQLTNLKHNLD